MARIRPAIVGAALALCLSPAQSRAEFDPTSDAHRAVQAQAQHRKAERAAAEAGQGAQALDPVYEPTFGEWQDATGARRSRLVVWMGGVYSGLNWANAEAIARGQTPTFCPSPQLRMTGQDVADMVTAYARGAAPPARNYLLGAVVVTALKSAFPCPAARP